MSGKLLLLEKGAMETRAALVEDSAPARLWFGPALGSEGDDARPLAGRTFIGRVTSINKALGAAFVNIGAETDGFLRLRDGVSLEEGQLIEAHVTAPPRQSKGAVLELTGNANDGQGIGRAAPIPSSAAEALSAIGAGVEEIVVDAPDLLKALPGTSANVRMQNSSEGSSLFTFYNVDEALSRALAPTISLTNGGALHFAETAALVAIDVDTGALEGASSDRLREKIIVSAAHEVVSQISIRNISGRIIVDFPSIRARAMREKAAASVTEIFSALSRVSGLNLSRGNLLTMTRERRGATLWGETTEPALSDPVPGRRFTLDWIARSAVREAERRQAAAPSARLSLIAGAAVHDHLQTANLTERYLQRWGAPIKVSLDDNFEERRCDVVE